MKKLILLIALVLGMTACKKTEECKPQVTTEYITEPQTEAEKMYFTLLYHQYQYIVSPSISGQALPSYHVMFDKDIEGGEFIVSKTFRPYKLYLVLDTANYEVISISDTSVNLNDGLYIKK